ncbi:MAG: flagellar motor switch protein FliM [Planctomycetota bacterium]
MSDDSLSQNQVENLLKAMEEAESESAAPDADAPPAATPNPATAEPPTPPQADASAPAASRTKAPPKKSAAAKKVKSALAPPGIRVTAYDFKRPERVGKDQMRSMHSLHEAIARNFGASVSGMLRTMIEVKLLSVDQLTYSEFVFSLDNPSCFNVIQPSPLEGHWILDIAPVLSYAIIDRMLGGDPTPGETIKRPLTEIENRLMARVVGLFLEQLKAAWENIVPLDLSIDSTESNPQLVQIVPPNEVVILISFELLLGKNRGMMNLCVPFNTIEKFNTQLSNNGWVGYGKTKPSEESRATITTNVDLAPVDVVVTLARSKIRTGDLLGLSVGDVITTEKEVAHPLELSIQDVPKFHAKPGAFKGKKAVRIQSTLDKQE